MVLENAKIFGFPNKNTFFLVDKILLAHSKLLSLDFHSNTLIFINIQSTKKTFKKYLNDFCVFMHNHSEYHRDLSQLNYQFT